MVKFCASLAGQTLLQSESLACKTTFVPSISFVSEHKTELRNHAFLI